jgi:hypothetical protein
MSISYSSIVGFGSGKATLPSVETWGKNMNILRDPPKSIYTRKIDKVGQTSEITEMIDEATDRACEAILVYPRGINPMVAVSYDNYGNNGGQKSGNVSQVGLNVNGGSARQAFLPYRIMDRGAFRPPIRDQRDLLPLSRLPRVWTSSFSQPGFADFSKKAICQSDTGEEYRAIKSEDQMLKACIRPTATYQLETPIVENYEVKYVIKNPVQVSGFSGIQPKARFNGEIGQPVKMVEDPLRPDINVNQSGDYVRDAELSHFDTEKYTHEVLHSDVGTNISQNVMLTSLEDIYGVDTANRTKNHINIDYETPHTSYEKTEYIHGDINLDRALPYHESRTNKGFNIHTRIGDPTVERTYVSNRPVANASTNMGGAHLQAIDEISSRQYYLRPTVNPGGFDPVPTIPQEYHENSIQELDMHKSRMRQSIYEMQQDRNLALGNIPYVPQETVV